jgi:hypothetical protein
MFRAYILWLWIINSKYRVLRDLYDDDDDDDDEVYTFRKFVIQVQSSLSLV